MTFLAPAILFGTLLAAAPIIIHLLNRRRFRRIEWAPMDILKLTIQANRRRLQLEHWLLLLLRALAVILLFFALARPMMSATGLGGLFGGSGSRVARVVVLDDSLSMDLVSGTDRSFDRAVDALTEMLNGLGSQDDLTILLATDPTNPLVARASIEDPTDIINQIRALPLTDASVSWPAVVEAVDMQLAASAFPVREVTLVTDRQATGWTPGVTPVFERWAETDVTLRMVDVSSELGGNSLIASLQSLTRRPLTDEPIYFEAQIQHTGEPREAGTQATWTVNGESTPVALPALQSGRMATLRLEALVDEAGQIEVELRLPDDALAADNDRRLVVNVAPTLEVELVDGAPGADAFSSATDFLEVSFSLGNPWRLVQQIDTDWLTRPLGVPDVIVLADVASIDDQRAVELRERVEAGMGLVIFLGDRVDTASYNESLGGAGLLPANLQSINDASAAGLSLEPFADSPIAGLSDLPLAWLAEASPSRLATFEPMAALTDESTGDGTDEGTDTATNEPARVLARWNDDAQTPAVLERSIGEGRVLVFNMSADKDWLEWPSSPAFMITARMAVRDLAGVPDAGTNLLAGGLLQRVFEGTRAPERVRLRAPDPSANDAANAAIAEPLESALAVERPTDAAPRVVVGDTRFAGLYRLLWQRPDGVATQQDFAVNPDPGESDLQTLTDPQLAQLGGPLTIDVVQAGADAPTGQGNEFWRRFILILIALIIGETALATWVDRDR